MPEGVLSIPTPRWAVPLLEPARYKGIKGGRASGKSHERAEAMIEAHILDQNSASVCIREVQKTLQQSVKRLLEAKIESLGAQQYFEVQESIIKSRHGKGLIIFQGMQNHTADSIKSLEGFDRAWVEEAQTLSQRSLDLLRPTIRKPGSELWFTWNPNSPDDPVDALLCGETPPPGAIVVHVNYQDNPWCPDEMLVEAEYDRKRDPEKYRHVWEGGYLTNSETRVFKRWRVEECEPPNGAVFRYGADFGYSIDPSCALRCWIEGHNLYVDHESYRIGCEIDELPDLFMAVPEIERWPLISDSSRPETINYLRRHGFPKIQSAVKGARSLEEGVSFLQSYDIIVHPRCVHLIDELTHYSYKRDPLTDKILSVLEDKNNHLIDALRYACEAVRRNPKNRQPRDIVHRPLVMPGSASWMGA